MSAPLRDVAACFFSRVITPLFALEVTRAAF